MLQMPIEQIIEKIKEKSELSEDDINAKIAKKLDALSGLISREGAAHIIANELGVKLFEQVSGKLQVKNILAGMRNVEVAGKVVAVYEIREFQKEDRTGKVGNIIIGDETGTIRVVIWGSKADILKELQPGTIVSVKSGYVRENQGNKEIHMNEKSEIIVDPPGVSIGDVNTDKPKAVRKKVNELTEQDSNVEILGTIVQAFEPKFYEVCGQCGKRARPEEAGCRCATHGIVDPDYSYVMNVFLDDGTEPIRLVAFREMVEKLAGKTKEQIMVYKENPAEFDSVKTELLGQLIKATGRVTKNTMFERLEFVANDIDTKPDPDEEIKKLNDEKGDPAPGVQEEPKTPEEQVTAEVEKINNSSS